MKKSQPARPTVPKPNPMRVVPIAVGLFLLVLAVFWSASNNGFVNYDDPTYVTDNEFVKQGLTWGGLKWAFTSTSEASNWHPVTWLSHMLDYQLYGASPRGHHLTSIFLHAINATLVFLLVNRLTGLRWRSLAVALLFGLHPLRVESVAWVSERKDVLSACFFFLSLYAYICWRQRVTASIVKKPAGDSLVGRVFLLPGLYLLALFFAALGLMSKAMLVTLPFVLLLLDYWPLRRFDREKIKMLLIEKVPFLLLIIPVAVITMRIQKAGGAFSVNLPLPLRLETSLIGYARYLGKLLWPANLAIEYPYPPHWPTATVTFAIVIVGSISFLVIRARRQYPYLFTGWCWYLGMLVPVIGLVQVGVQSMADRYSYLPCIGVLVMIVWGASDLAKASSQGQLILGALAGAISVACLVVTEHQIGFWKDNGTFYQHVLETNGKSSIVLENLAGDDIAQGRFAEAEPLYRELLAKDPHRESAQLNLGVALFKSGQADAGIHQLEEAIKIFPNAALLHGNLGIFLSTKGRFEEAQAELETALRLKPDYVEGHVLLGDLCAHAGKRQEAIAHYQQALKIRPGFPPARQRLQSLGLG